MAPRRITAEQLARAYYRAQAAVSRRTVARVQALWRGLDWGDLSSSWLLLTGPAVVRTVRDGQAEAARAADPYIEAIIAAAGAESDPAGHLRAAAFAGRAADGRPLESLLYLPIITTKRQIAAGRPASEAMMAGLHQILKMSASEVADAGRTAAGAAIAKNRTIRGYIRVATPPACSRCAILAGKEYGWNAGFQRHPRCDCVHVPATLVARGRGGRRTVPAAPGLITDPKRYFESLSRAEQDRIFTKAGAQAIRDGADINAVVNARRGMSTAGSRVEQRPGGAVTHRGRTTRTAVHGQQLLTTREGTTRRGLWYRQEYRHLQQQGLLPPGSIPRGVRLPTARLVPEEIYRLADTREEAIRMLRRYGYIT